ncbi:MAG: hypothetical protein U9R02_14840 [Thermodesulfobacteriota bacterium]|nr:hypothetical protein [Thermodesulfobacteriota bacterium]
MSDVRFLVPMLPRGNAYRKGSHAGAWEPGNIFSEIVAWFIEKNCEL